MGRIPCLGVFLFRNQLRAMVSFKIETKMTIIFGEKRTAWCDTFFCHQLLIHARHVCRMNGWKLWSFYLSLPLPLPRFGIDWFYLSSRVAWMESGPIHYPDDRQWVGGKPMMVVGGLYLYIDSIFPRNGCQFIHKDDAIFVLTRSSSTFHICMSLPNTDM